MARGPDITTVTHSAWGLRAQSTAYACAHRALVTNSLISPPCLPQKCNGAIQSTIAIIINFQHVGGIVFGRDCRTAPRRRTPLGRGDLCELEFNRCCRSSSPPYIIRTLLTLVSCWNDACFSICGQLGRDHRHRPTMTIAQDIIGKSAVRHGLITRNTEFTAADACHKKPSMCER